MAKDILIYRICPKCGGDGVVTTSTSVPPYPMDSTKCVECRGPNVSKPKSGYVLWGVSVEDK